MKLKAGFALFIFSVSVAFFGVFAGTVTAKPIEISFSNFFPPSHFHGKLGQEYCDAIEKRTNGKVKMTYYPGGSLVTGAKTYGAVLDGITDIGFSVLGYSRGVFPALEAIDLPLGYKSGSQATRIINAFAEEFKLKELNKVKVMLFHAHGPGLIHSKDPVRKLEDLKGMKVRCYGFSVKIIEALGGVPVAMGQSQAYEALQKGVCNATLVPIEALKGWNQAEVINYTSETTSIGYTSGLYVFMNKDKWASLPKDVQAVFEQVNKEWIDKFGAAWDASDAAGREYTLEKGNEIIPMTAEENARWKAAVQPVIGDWVKDATKKGLPAQEYVDFLKEAVKTY
ncbi:TRAP transporter substrate-binding protein [Desulfobacula sp.]|uniref:TRAP transporter substrate-binding protein n=1 Tax=Desulfobacula sp. TaxID=2593537 RepID=UPI00260D5F02|nr:TRAP transporter substrate-binding protein [Desulfobacula sp.]